MRGTGVAVKSGLKWLDANPADGPFDAALISLTWGEALKATVDACFADAAGDSTTHHGTAAVVGYAMAQVTMSAYHEYLAHTNR